MEVYMFGKDIFNEQLVVRQPTKKDLFKKIGLVILLIVILGLLVSLPSLIRFMPYIVVVLIVILVVLFKRMNIEYEYIFTNGELDIDKIINKSKRKSVVSIHVNRFKIMAPIMNKDYEKDLASYTKLYDFSSGQVSESTYGVIYEIGDQRVKMIFEPNEKMFKAIRRYIPKSIKN